MTPTQQWLQDLRMRGVQVVFSNGRVWVTASQGALTAEVRQHLRDRRAELLA